MTAEIKIFGSLMVALFAALFVIPKLAHIANRIGLVDHPNDRKMHRVPRPLVGGIGIVISATFSGFIFLPLDGLRGFFAGLAVLLLVGFFDDFLEVGHRQKFLAQIVATGFLIYYSKVFLHDFGNLLGLGAITVPSHTWLIWLVTIFCVVGVTNALNMIDGLDGLAGGVTLIALLVFSVLASLEQEHGLMLLSLTLAGAVLGFLRYNWSPASLFMGDAGSLCLGFVLAFLSIALTQKTTSSVYPVISLLVLAVPISDTITVMVRRIFSRKSPFTPDKTHLHHVLIRCGLEKKQAVIIILTLCFFFGVIAIYGVLYSLPEPLLFSIFLFYFILNFYSEAVGRRVVNMVRSLRRKEKPQHCPEMIHSVFNLLSINRFFRGAERHRIKLALSCSTYDSDMILKGEIINISRTGFRAEIPNLGLICKECEVSILWPDDENQKSVEFAAEHLWSTTVESKELHGFRFCDLDKSQTELLVALLDRLVEEKERG